MPDLSNQPSVADLSRGVRSRLNDLLLSLIAKINTPVLADASLMSVDEDAA